MAKSKYRGQDNKRGESLLSSEELDEEILSSKKDVNDKRKITLLELADGKDINETLKDLGSKNLSIKDVAIIAGISPKRLQSMFDKGEKDFEDDVVSTERLMYQNYMLGLKSLECATVVDNLRFKNPDKLLASINPEKYSDSMVEKFALPIIEINVGDRPVSIGLDDSEEIENIDEIEDKE